MKDINGQTITVGSYVVYATDHYGTELKRAKVLAITPYKNYLDVTCYSLRVKTYDNRIWSNRVGYYVTNVKALDRVCVVPDMPQSVKDVIG